MKALTALAAVSVFALISGAALAQDDAVEPPPMAPPFMGVELAEGPWSFATAQADIDVEIVSRDLERPWSIAFLGDDAMLVTERPGRLRVVRDGVLDPTPIAGLPAIYNLGIAGLMDIALHPDFENNRLIYMSYSKPDPDNPQNSVLAVMRARWDGGYHLENVEDIFIAQAWYGAAPMPEKCCGQGPAFGSFGGRILFDDEGYLFLTSGDRNFGEMVSNPANHFGKILRLTDDGGPAPGNPWERNLGHAPEVWSTGHRNPLGLYLDRETGVMWESEFGPRGGDEVNIITPGANYGWMAVTQGHHYDGTPAEGIRDVEGVTDAVIAYGPPSLNPGNLTVYHGDAFPQWEGDLLLASFTQGLLRYDVDAEGNLAAEPENLLVDLGQRWRDVRAAPDGSVYVLTDMTQGALIRITPAD